MGIGRLLLCAALLCAGVAPASATMRIAEDRGGQIGHYLQAFAMLRTTGERVVIDGPGDLEDGDRVVVKDGR